MGKKETSIMFKALYISGFLCYSMWHNLNYILFMNLFPFSLNEDSNNHPDAGRDWGQEEKGMTEDEMAGWHHQLDGHEFE